MMDTYYTNNNTQLAALLNGLTRPAPARLHSFQPNMLYCIISNTGLTERYSFVSFEGKKAQYNTIQLNIKVSTELLGMSK